jgi:hypothetical protein
MISVIISSANKQMLANVRQNIAETIGVPFEVLAFDNSTGAKGICAVYNEGIQQAQYKYLCFVHEDVVFKTLNWGQNVVQIFEENHRIGLIGIAGSSYKPLTPSGWQGNGLPTDYLNILQAFKYKGGEPELFYRNPKNEKLARVASVDGVWFCTTRKVCNQIKFDEQTFKGFHGYDTDFSLAVGRQYDIVVTYNVLLHHLSDGNFDKNWFYEVLKLHKKWNKHLPVCTENLTGQEKLIIEKATFRTFVEHLITLKMPASVAYAALWQNNRFFKVYRMLFFKLNVFIYKAYKAARRENRI